MILNIPKFIWMRNSKYYKYYEIETGFEMRNA